MCRMRKPRTTAVEASSSRVPRYRNLSNSCERVHRGAKRPQRSGTQRVLFYHGKRKNTKKTERTLDFSPIACKLCFGIAFLFARNPVSSSFQLVISAKGDENRPSLKQLFCSKVRNIPAGTIVSLCLACWAFFCSSFEQVLGRTFITAYGEASGFFCVWMSCRELDLRLHFESGCRLVRRNTQSTPRPPMSPFACPDSHHLILLPENYLTGGLSLSSFLAPKGKT